MKNRLNNSNVGKLLFSLDIVIISISLFSSWIIRSRFSFFLYDLKEFIFLFPWILFSRLFCHLFFGLYSFGLVSFGSKDISRIFKYNTIPTSILFVLRIVSMGNDILRMPLSMIVMEYIFSTFGFVILRLMIHSFQIRNTDDIAGYCHRIILWGEIQDIKKEIDIDVLKNKHNIEVLGIINSNPLFWNREYNKIRVYGNEEEIEKILASDDRIASVAFLPGYELSKKQKKRILNQIEQLNLDIGIIIGNKFYLKDSKWLINDFGE